jgi:CubicO group peptidase (beta-lactamase class C family)
MLFRVRSAWFGFRILPILIVVSTTATYSCSQSVDTSKVFGRENAFITAETRTDHFRGAVLVGLDGKIIFEKPYGPADEEWNVPNSPRTKFRIASLTKQFTAACILLLQERGLLKVQESISKYLSGLPGAWRAVTIHQLLTHTSGVPTPDYGSEQYAKTQRAGATPQELVGLVASRPLDFTPGTKWNYSNTGYILLGMLIEKLSSESYADFLNSNVFRSLGHDGFGIRSGIQHLEG